MHEFSICRTIVDSVLEELSKLEPRRGRLVRVGLVAGACHQIVPDNLRTAYEVMSRNTPAEGSALDIDWRPVTVHCRPCGWNGEIVGYIYSCGSCGGGDLEVTGGKELYLDKLVIERDEDC